MRPLKYLREIRSEMEKVTWPSFGQTRMFSFGVVMLAVFIGAYLWGVDLLISVGVKWAIGA